MSSASGVTIADEWTMVEFSIPVTASADTLANLLLTASTANSLGCTGAATNDGLTANQLSRVVSVILMGEITDGTTERGQVFYSKVTAPTRKLPIEAGDEKEFPLTARGLKTVFLSVGTEIEDCAAEVYMTKQLHGDIR